MTFGASAEAIEVATINADVSNSFNELNVGQLDGDNNQNDSGIIIHRRNDISNVFMGWKADDGYTKKGYFILAVQLQLVIVKDIILVK